MKTLYHGTVTTWLPEIMREGLKPVSSHRWNFVSPAQSVTFASVERGTKHVYLAQYKSDAEWFAKFRASYLKTEPGHHIKNPDEGFLTPIVKTEGEYIPAASPALLSVSLPESWPLFPDPSSNGVYSPRPIPPQYLQVVAQ